MTGPVRVDEAFLDRVRSPRGGWTRETLKLLGVPWPPKKGWKVGLLGKVISGEAVEGLLALSHRPVAVADREPPVRAEREGLTRADLEGMHREGRLSAVEERLYELLGRSEVEAGYWRDLAVALREWREYLEGCEGPGIPSGDLLDRIATAEDALGLGD